MELRELCGAIDRLNQVTVAPGSRAATYLRTYPAILAATDTAAGDRRADFLHVAVLAYGWMPRIVRVKPDHLENASEQLSVAREVAEDTWRTVNVAAIAECLSSVTGASKVLHFVKPSVFPIWDSKVCRVWNGREPTQYQMQQTNNYLEYVREVHEMRLDREFRTLFYERFLRVYQEQHRRLGIEPYEVSEVRAIEAAAFSLVEDTSET